MYERLDRKCMKRLDRNVLKRLGRKCIKDQIENVWKTR